MKYFAKAFDLTFGYPQCKLRLIIPTKLRCWKDHMNMLGQWLPNHKTGFKKMLGIIRYSSMKLNFQLFFSVINLINKLAWIWNRDLSIHILNGTWSGVTLWISFRHTQLSNNTQLRTKILWDNLLSHSCLKSLSDIYQTWVMGKTWRIIGIVYPIAKVGSHPPSSKDICNRKSLNLNRMPNLTSHVKSSSVRESISLESEWQLSRI